MKPVRSNIRGARGEKKVNSALNPLFFGKIEHRQINNLMLADENGKSHQIDHVEIRHNGIFCIETKNFSGVISGTESAQSWTQYLGTKINKFTNPIKQNDSHVYHLSKALNGRYKINSVIVMVQNNAERINVPYVVNLCELRNYLATFDDGTHYPTEEMDQIYNTLMSAARNDISKREHLKNIRETQTKLSKNICPRCNKKLILRNGRYGSFYGCTGYPDCKFTKNVEE